jgi:plasmid maintenance system killer protein
MPSKSALSTLKVILVIDLIIVAIAAPSYLYVDSLIPKSASFQVTDLIIDPALVQVGESVEISVNVTNVGEQSGEHMVNLMIDDEPIATETILLSGGENVTLVFTATELSVGEHTVKVEDLNGSIIVSSEAPTKPAELEITNLGVSRIEAQAGETITVSATAANVGDEAGNFSLELFVNDVKRETKDIQLESGETQTVQFEIVENSEGDYVVRLGTLTKSFKITSEAQPPKPAEFKVTNLMINPLVVVGGENVAISVTVTNVGEESGSYSVSLKIDGAERETKEVTLSGGVSEVVKFEIAETSSGTHTVVIGDQTGSFTVEGTTGPASPDVEITSVIVNPYEVWEGDTVTVKGKADNLVDEPSTLQVRVLFDGEPLATRGFELDASASDSPFELTFVAGAEGGSIKIVNLGNEENTKSGYFKVVPEGFHSIFVSSYPIQGIPFTLDGEPLKTPYNELLPADVEYTFTVLPSYDGGRYLFMGWEDGSTSLTHTITLTERMTVVPDFSGGISCPSLYTWNGTGYYYNAEISNSGWLGYIGYMDENGSIVFVGGNPWDGVKLNPDQFQLKKNGDTGYYDIILTQRWDEIFYLDAAYLVVADHPSNVDVYSTMVHYVNPAFTDEIYTVSTNPLTPISTVNEKGEDVLSCISENDGIFTPATNGVTSPSLFDPLWNRLTLNLGDLSDAPRIKLIINGMVDWGPARDYYDWIDRFDAAYAEGLVPNGTELTPPPYIEVLDEHGDWVPVPDDRQMPIPGDYVARPFVVDLTGIFLTNNYSIRINNFWNVTFDYIGVDITPQMEITTQRIDPIADLHQAFTGFSDVEGKFTRYGDVSELLLDDDDMFVIGKQGDEVSLHFLIDKIAPPEEGVERDFFFFVACWFKDTPDNWGYGFDFAIEPLPFRNMSGFPYTDAESYPYDAEHTIYLQEYNTRVIEAPVQLQMASLSTWMGAVILLIAIVDLGVVTYFRRPN